MTDAASSSSSQSSEAKEPKRKADDPSDERQSKRAKEGVDEDLSCSICFEVFREPVTISCGHTFCRLCLRRCLRTKEECPECRLPQKRDTKFSTNTATQKVIERLKIGRPSLTVSERVAFFLEENTQDYAALNVEKIDTDKLARAGYALAGHARYADKSREARDAKSNKFPGCISTTVMHNGSATAFFLTANHAFGGCWTFPHKEVFVLHSEFAKLDDAKHDGPAKVTLSVLVRDSLEDLWTAGVPTGYECSTSYETSTFDCYFCALVTKKPAAAVSESKS